MDRALNVSLIALCWSVVLAVTGIGLATCLRIVQVSAATSGGEVQLSALRR